MRVVFLPHARERMALRNVTEEEALAVLGEPDAEYPGDHGRIVAERVLPGRRLATKVVYNLGAEQERIVVTVERGRPKGGTR
ncbi:MAG: DUF4258 domain-containing protein [Actinomycetota bacterium]|nr:DUF4258 domain-containing protein [Actinomycetota bacterium]